MQSVNLVKAIALRAGAASTHLTSLNATTVVTPGETSKFISEYENWLKRIIKAAWRMSGVDYQYYLAEEAMVQFSREEKKKKSSLRVKKVGNEGMGSETNRLKNRLTKTINFCKNGQII